MSYQDFAVVCDYDGQFFLEHSKCDDLVPIDNESWEGVSFRKLMTLVEVHKSSCPNRL